MYFTTKKEHVIRIFIVSMTMLCSFFGQESLAQNPVISSVNVNSCVGSITISVTSGVAPYTYEWKDDLGNVLPFTTFIASGLAAGDYTVEVTDNNGNSTGAATYTVTNPPDLVGSVVVNDVSCRGDSDAQVIITMANGNPGYDWELFNGGMSSISSGSVAFPSNIITLGGLGVGNYTVSVTDQDGCTGDINFTVTQPADFLAVNIASSTDATCFDSTDGTITANPTGGWGDYVYQWERVSDGAIVGSTQTVTGLAPGQYRLNLSDRFGTGCTVVSGNVTIGSPPQIIASETITNTLCNGDANGSIDISVSGGVGPYTYLWNTGSTSEDLGSLLAGSYSVTVTDAVGCTALFNYTITEPAVLAVVVNKTDIACFGDISGSITTTVSGGTGPYTYSWSNGNTTANLSSLSVGTYDLTVTDANGCTTSVNGTTISQPASALTFDSSTETLPSCFGGNDGSIDVTFSGGTGPYTYLWSDAQTGATATNLSSGIYSVTATDANGCTFVQNITLNDPVRINVSATLNTPSCNAGANGSITVSASNGTAPYTYNWNTGDSGPTINGIVAGNYAVTVTDATGCSVVENYTLGEPAPLLSNATKNDISCNGLTDGNISVLPSGGTGPYTYLWSTGATSNSITGLTAGNYSVAVTDANGCAINENFTVVDPAPIGLSTTIQDVLCKGASTGSIDLSVSGGTAPYTYLWSNGSNTEDLSTLTAGTYSVIVQDAGSCSVNLNVTINEPTTVLTLTGATSDISCNGGNNGSIDLTVTGGDGPYTYSWSSGPTTEDVTNLGPGNYSVSVTDANGCIKSLGFTLTEPAPLAINGTQTNITCNGNIDGTISTAVSGGTAPYTYSWSDDISVSSANRSNLSTGVYTLTTTDANGCQVVESFTITEPSILNATAITQNISCFGELTGSINLSPTGGVAPYTFSWSNGALTEDLAGLASGTYTVNVTDANGCVFNASYTLTQPTSALAITSNVSQISCNGLIDGAIDIEVSGGTGPYTYNWSNGATSQDLSGLTASAYNVTVTDANGCTETAAFNITNPPLLVLSNTVNNVSCFNAANGSIAVTPSGGEGPYSYLWSNGETSSTVNNLLPGNYSVVVTDARGCTVNDSFVITQPNALGLSYTKTDVNCFGNSDGTIDITVVGGTAPYAYSWSTGASSEDLNGLSAQDYTVTITDANGCTISETVTISQPSASLSIANVVNDISCFGGADGNIQITPSGGTAPYTYNWNTGSTSSNIAGLGVGTYQVTVTDANGCQATDSYSISMPAVLLAAGTVSDVSCNGSMNGAIDLTVSGGTGPYNYFWSNGSTSEDLSGLSGGNYSVTITDGTGCSLVRNFTVTEPLPISAISTINNVDCFGEADGSIELSVSGGIGSYTYSWSNGETTKDIFNLSGGTYQVTITDSNGCENTLSYDITEPVSALEITGIVSDELCNGDGQGTIDISVSGGTGPYTYFWNTGQTTQDIAGLTQGNYQVTITDANNCTLTKVFAVSGPSPISIAAVVNNVSCNGNTDGTIDVAVSGGTGPYTYLWSNGAATSKIEYLATGTYSVTITDGNGCQSFGNYTITEPLPLSANASVQGVTCFGDDNGQIDLNVSGGNAPYSYSWSNGSSNQDLQNLNGGDYTVTITDSKGCSLEQTFSVSAPTAALLVSPTISDALCNNDPSGGVVLDVSGGTAPYSFNWSNGSSQKDITNVFAGEYEYVVTDANGCSFSQTVTISQPEAISVSFDVVNSTCLGDTDGSVRTTVSGGNGPYTYVWSNGSTASDIINVQGGTYNVTITDASGCSITEAVSVGDSRDLVVSIQKQDVLCKGESTGTIDLSVSGGSGNYTYTWDDGETTTSRSNLLAGVYRIVIVDDSGCGTSSSIVIGEPSESLSVEISGTTNLACFGDNGGTLLATPSGGVAPYTYLWSNGARTSSLEGLIADSYTVTVTDANGCISQATSRIIQPESPIQINVSGNLDLSCNGQSDGHINLEVSGGSGNYQYLWSTGSQESGITGLSAGDYTVRVIDENGCVEERIFTISEPDELIIESTRVNESQCFDDRNGSIELDISGGTGPFTYQWSTGATTKNLIGISSGEYEVSITDANGCSVSSTFSLADPERFVLSPEIQPISCRGANDATISLNIEGGIGPMNIQWNTGDNQETITNISPGEYNVLVTDKNGCTLQSTFNIVEPFDLSLDAFVEEAARCNDPRSGRVNLIVSGGSEPYRYRWSSGDTTSNITDVLPGTYVVEVTDKFNCTVQGTYTVLQPEPLQIGLSTEPFTDCENRIAGVVVKADVKGGIGNYVYSWSKGDSPTNEVILTEAGRVTIEVSDFRGCFQMNSIDIDIPELGEADFNYNARSIDETGDLAANDPVSFFDLSVGEVIDWHWDFGDGFDSNEIDPIHTYDAPGTYEVTLTVTDRTGCQALKTTILEITEGYRVMVPNAFTPNGDGKNDFFRPQLLGLEKVQLIIYNTWGEVVFSTEDLETKGWNGMVNGLPAENGNYVYKLIGLSFNGLEVERDGIFALIK